MSSKEYAWLSVKEHAKKRPDTYVGPVQPCEQQAHVFQPPSGAEDRLVCSDVTTTFSPAIVQFFQEILSNACDNHRRDPTQRTIKVHIQEDGVFSVYNDGGTIPIEKYKDTQRYLPEILFGEFMSGENFNDSQKREGIGRNGIGAKIVVLFAKWFTIELVNLESKCTYKQTFREQLDVIEPPVIASTRAKHTRSSTLIRWLPAYNELGMSDSSPLSSEVCKVLAARVYDVAACTASKLSVYLNDAKLAVRDLKDYTRALGSGSLIAHETVADEDGAVRMEVCFALPLPSDGLARTVGFVNGTRCSFGTHIDLVHRKVAEAFTNLVTKRLKRVTTIRPAHIKERLTTVISIAVVNPSFSTQTKEKLDTRADKLGVGYNISMSTLKAFEKSNILDELAQNAEAVENKQLQKSVKTDKLKTSNIPKYERALELGKAVCSLYVTEGDSAKSLAVSGFSVIGRKQNGVFPLRGKLVNVRGMKPKKALENVEVLHLSQILGLDPTRVYDADSVQQLPYRYLVIFTDQDTDGSHIMGLLINLFDALYPSLLRTWPDFLRRFATPIVRVSLAARKWSFFSLPEYREWCRLHEDQVSSARIKYYKGLGTSTNEEAKELFRNIDDHLISIEHTGTPCAHATNLFFDPSKATERKQMLTNLATDSCIDYRLPKTSIVEFCQKELVQYGHADNVRSIPSVIDGYKPSQRKVLFVCLAQKNSEEHIVERLASTVAARTAYHHGTVSLVETIVAMAQPYVGTNNLAVLENIGQFGDRHSPRTVHSASRYINTRARPIARDLFLAADNPVLSYLEDDGKQVEPVYFVPIVPTVLINGTEGIGYGWSTFVPNFDVRDVIRGTRALIRQESFPFSTLKPCYTGFGGTVTDEGNGVFVFHGKCSIEKNGVRITELPPRVWTSSHVTWINDTVKPRLDFILEVINESVGLNEISILLRCRQGTDLTSHDWIKELRLTQKINLNNMILFDEHNKLHRFPNVQSIFEEHARVRRKTYQAQLQHLIQVCDTDRQIASSKAFFVNAVRERRLDLVPLTKDQLRDWCRANKLFERGEYDYILQLGAQSFTADVAAQLIDHARACTQELARLKAQTVENMWLHDLDRLENNFLEYSTSLAITESSTGTGKRKKGTATDASARKKK